MSAPSTTDDKSSDENCPFPDVAKALRPFIKTRQEAAQIRKRLQASLPLSPLNVSQPAFRDTLDPSSLSGVRKAYWRALKAHETAQSRYDALKAELGQIVHSQPSSNSGPEEDPTSLIESYVPLLQQREKQRKLRVIEATYATVHDLGFGALGESFDKVAKREVGELPAPPSNATFSDREAGSGYDYDLAPLKRAILLANQRIAEHQSTTAQANGIINGGIDPHADLKALQIAHNELTTWMEGQLSLISNVEAPKEADDDVSPAVTSNGHASHSMNEIEDLYEHYLLARQRLLDAVETPTTTIGGFLPDESRRNSENVEAEYRPAYSEALLPSLPDLIRFKQREQSLLLQSAYTRRQLASVEFQTQAVLSRLAGESHLVQPDINSGTPHSKDWVKAATDADSATVATAAYRVKSGRTSTQSASMTLESIQSVPSSLDGVLK